MLERIKPLSRAVLVSVPLFAVAVAGCGGSNTEAPNGDQPERIDLGESTSNITFYDVGEVESYGANTDVGYYEYTDEKGRVHVCDIATNARGGTQGVGLSCEILLQETTTSAPD